MPAEIKRLTFEILRPFIDQAIAQGYRLTQNYFHQLTDSGKICCPVTALTLPYIGKPGSIGQAELLGYHHDYLWGFVRGFDGKTTFFDERTDEEPHRLGRQDGALVLQECVKYGYIKAKEKP